MNATSFWKTAVSRFPNSQAYKLPEGPGAFNSVRILAKRGFPLQALFESQRQQLGNGKRIRVCTA
jgi:hypothetical protein